MATLTGLPPGLNLPSFVLLHSVCHGTFPPCFTANTLPAAAAKFDVDRKSTVFIFMGAQLLYTLLTLLPTKLMYDHHVSAFPSHLETVCPCW